MLKADDGDHDRAKSFAARFSGTLIAIWPVVTEVAHFVSRAGRDVLLSMILRGDLRIEDFHAEDIERMRGLLAKFGTMDFADASLVAIGERLDLYDVVTLDRRDFAIYRSRSGRAFVNRFGEAS